MVPLRRYAPFVILVAVQLMLVLVAPSKGPATAGNALGGTFDPNQSSSGQPGAAVGGPAVADVPGSTSSAGSAAGSADSTGTSGSTGGDTGSGAATSAGGGGTGADSSSGGAQTSAGRTSAATAEKHCVTGLIAHYPCTAKWQGGDNGGATSMGVTKDSVKVIMYRNKDNAAVNAITQASGAYTSPADEQSFLTAAQNWVNAHFQLYNRKVQFIYYQGTCDIAPPQDSCFRSEADAIAGKYHPFALFWDNDATESAFFDELSRKGVVNLGGWNFSDTFDNSLRPYHYDALMGGDKQAEITAEWWCKRMANKKARFAGGSLTGQTRKVAITFSDTSVMRPAAEHMLSLIKQCDKNGPILSPYSPDTSTAASQSTTNTAKLKQAGVTSIIWFSDPIAPAYGTKQQTAQNYFPEEIPAGSGLVDYDSLAQNYDQTAWAHTVGPSDLGQYVQFPQSDAATVYKQGGGSGSASPNTNLMWGYISLVALGIEKAGPKLTPLSFEYGLLTMPGFNDWSSYHDPRLTYTKFGKGDYTALSDIREVYWDPNKTSPVNGRAGTYVELNGGRRYQSGQIPSGEPSAPVGG